MKEYHWKCKRMYRKNPKIRSPETSAVIILTFEQSGFNIEKCIQNMQTEWQTV